MAGIGFELKKLFAKKGLFSLLRAYGYAGIVCTGPMILGVILLLGVHFLSVLGGATKPQQDLLNAMITYTLLASLLVTSLFSMLSTRYVADEMYINHHGRVMPSFYGSIAIMLVLGGGLYGTFLCFCGVKMIYRILCFILFGLLVIVWTEINYLTAIKDYKGILVTFAVSLVIGLLIGLVLMMLKLEVTLALFIGVNFAYGLMMVSHLVLLTKYFPKGKGSSVRFLKYTDMYPSLTFVGFFGTLGMFGHLIIMWASPWGQKIQGIFYGAPKYDVAALVAFLSILITTINFVTSVEVNFYPYYKNYFSLYNDGGSILDIDLAEKEMLTVMEKEISYTAIKQFFATIFFIIFGTILLPATNMGFNSEMLGVYRVLCIGYAFYAIANTIMLISLYFADNKGALIGTAVFALVSNLGTVVTLFFPSTYYGLGFLIGGMLFYFFAMIRLKTYTNKLSYHVLCAQPMVARVYEGFFTKIANRCEQAYSCTHKQEEDEEDETEE
ncbi:MAG: exopolysaccharide Pel transporter PelG [Oscillospiraceae bacterium]|nr:exopolysaccharide Pel transporter PelG [Oscillospiraceae bacterium]